MIPDNAWWYHLAYAVTAAGYIMYAISLWWRRSKIARRQSTSLFGG
jgi:hypothetical protein